MNEKILDKNDSTFVEWHLQRYLKSAKMRIDCEETREFATAAYNSMFDNESQYFSDVSQIRLTSNVKELVKLVTR